ncbi:Uncharacterized mitochondrial protein AtMg00310 [Linum grandiflorum]
MMNFWWGQKASERRIHWINKHELLARKADGGMGFRDMRGFNTALLSKKLWNLSQRPQSLIGRILKAKYHKHSSILEAGVGYRPSFIWRSLMSVQEFLWHGIRWRVGNGASISIWGDRWIPTLPGNFISSTPTELANEAKVCELINPSTGQWDIELVERYFSAVEAEAILQLPLREPEDEDRLIWSNSRGGLYTSKAGYTNWLDEFLEANSVTPKRATNNMAVSMVFKCPS